MPLGVAGATTGTTTTVTSSLNPSSYGTSIMFTATVRPTVPNNEVVMFYSNGTSLGTGRTSGGVATYATTTLAVGSENITATYAGDANYTRSTSSALIIFAEG